MLRPGACCVRLQVDLSDESDWSAALELYSQAAAALLARAPEDEAPDTDLAFALHVCLLTLKAPINALPHSQTTLR